MDRLEETKGLTLVEMVMTVVVLGILGLFTFSYLGTFTSTYTVMEKQRRIYSEVTYAVERISRELRDAQGGVSTGAGTIAFRLSHATPADGSPYVRYRLSNQVLYRDSGPTAAYGTSKILADYVTAFAVSPVALPPGSPQGSPFYSVGVTITKDGQSETLAAQISPKNYSALSDSACVFAGRDFGGCYQDVIY